MRRGRGELGGLGREVADLAQKGFVGRLIVRLVAMGAMPAVDLGLEPIAPGEQGAVARREVADQGGEPGPEGGRLDAGARQCLRRDEVVQNGGDRHAVDVYSTQRTRVHGRPPGCIP